MKIKLVLIDTDINYVEKIMNRLQTDYANKLEISFFRTLDTFYNYVSTNHVHIILADEKLEIDFEKLPEKSTFAYLTSLAGVEELYGRKAICKFQKIDAFYKEILSAFSESSMDITFKTDETSAQVYLFLSSKGGVGTSTSASAFAVKKAKGKQKVLYLNLETYGTCESYFSGEGNSSFSDIIFTVKSKKNNLSLKLESAAKIDTATGVMFFDSAVNAYDMLELNKEETMQIVAELVHRSGYEYVVIDCECNLNERILDIIKQYCKKIIIVNDGSDMGNTKTERLLSVLKIIESRKDMAIMDKVSLLYNGYIEGKCKKINNPEIKEAGIIPLFSGESTRQLIQKIAKMPMIEE